MLLAAAGAGAALKPGDHDLARRTPVDGTRVYATGLSNGSMMAYRFAAEASDRVAAVAGVAGAMTLPNFAPKRPVAVMHIHNREMWRFFSRFRREPG